MKYPIGTKFKSKTSGNEFIIIAIIDSIKDDRYIITASYFNLDGSPSLHKDLTTDFSFDYFELWVGEAWTQIKFPIIQLDDDLFVD